MVWAAAESDSRRTEPPEAMRCHARVASCCFGTSVNKTGTPLGRLLYVDNPGIVGFPVRDQRLPTKAVRPPDGSASPHAEPDRERSIVPYHSASNICHSLQLILCRIEIERPPCPNATDR